MLSDKMWLQVSVVGTGYQSWGAWQGQDRRGWPGILWDRE